MTVPTANKVIFSTVLFIVVWMVYLFTVVTISSVTNQVCIQSGYDYSTVTWNLRSYCIRWDGNRQINVPLSDIKRK